MQDERIFGPKGGYELVVRRNVLGHEEFGEMAIIFLTAWFRHRPVYKIVRVLDLACGGFPTVIARAMAKFRDQQFEYIGVDIHPDQVAAAKAYQFPPNVRARIVQGDAWLPGAGGKEIEGPFALIYSGFHLHHGVPEEIYALAQHCKPLLLPDGTIINHDLYRPAAAAYLRRPERDPRPPHDSFAQIESARRVALPREDIVHGPVFGEQTEVDWREAFLARYRPLLAEIGLAPDTIDAICAHIAARDFPLSLPEMERLWTAAGYRTTSFDLQGYRLPLKDYLGFFLAQPARAAATQ